ncbi:MAG: hypothetical protein QOD66_3603 [Solirubrobacteraceae bacterium]|jgi:hypothetical protein|nr:hypothetical protein [Solirubrobacteraceae bacterium]
MSLPPDHDRRGSLAARELSAIPPAAAFAHMGGATLLVLGYLALIPGFLPAFILGAALGLVLLVPMLAIAAASGLLLLPILALRGMARSNVVSSHHRRTPARSEASAYSLSVLLAFRRTDPHAVPLQRFGSVCFAARVLISRAPRL